MSQNALIDKLELWGFEEDFIIFSDGSLGFGLEATPVDIQAWDDDAINGYSYRVANFLNGLSDGLDIQFVQEIAGGHRVLIDRHAGLCGKDANLVAKRLCDERTLTLRKLDEIGELPCHKLLVFVRKSRNYNQRKSWFGVRRGALNLSEDNLMQDIVVMRQLRSESLQALSNLELKPKVIPSAAIMELVYKQWNPLRRTPFPAYAADDVRPSLVFTDAMVSEQGFSLGSCHHKVLSLKLLPDSSYAAMAARLRDLPFDSRVHLTIHVPNQQREIEALQTQRRLAFAMVHGKRSGVRDLDSQAKLDDLETLLETMIAQGEKVFHVSLNIVLRASSQVELEQQVSLTMMVFRELGGAEVMEETLAAFDIFCALAVPNARAKERVKRLKTSNLADFLPLYGPWPGHDSPNVLLRSRLGGLVSFDPFDPELANANQIVSGGSGAGKSFLTNVLLLHLIKEEPRIFIIDIGGSYAKLCESLGGQYVALGMGGDYAINPFDQVGSDELAMSQKVKFLVNLVELMTKEEGEARLPKLERAVLEEKIQEVLGHKDKAMLSGLREALLSHSDPAIARYGKILGPWCGKTPYGRFVDRETSIELKSPIICFDLKGLETHSDLQAVCLLLITDFIWREVQRDRSTKKLVIFDECWRLLENEAGASFLGEVFRTFRKYYASAIAISQNIDDFAKSRIAGAIMPNSAVKWILRQKGADQERLKSVLQLNDKEMALIESLRQERGVFSEAFLMAQDHRSVVAVATIPLEYWIATTDPRELAAIDEASKEEPGLTRLEILTKLALQYPRGLLQT